MVEVVIPWRAGCPHRKAALEWVLRQYARALPGWRVTVAPAPDGPWSKARAVAPAIEASDADTIVVADADVWAPGVSDAVRAIEELGYGYAVPHQYVHRLTGASTADVLGGFPLAPDLPTIEPPYAGVTGGGLMVLPRETALDVPLDPRFTGWGQEDESWGLALQKLAGNHWRGTGHLFHLWHPPQDRLDRRFGSEEGRELFRRYSFAWFDEGEDMRALIEEAKAC
ncbi:MAG: hypothetical protein PGN13_16340 [Patulibacter minatonensis]